MARRPPLRSVEVFAQAAAALSFAKAAAALHLTPSAVSHRIRELEAECGTALFLRHNRRLELTAAGARYHADVRDALAALAAAHERLRAGREDEVLRLSCTQSFASAWLMPRLAALQRAQPGLRVELRTGSELDDFAGGALHAAVRFGLGRWSGLAAHRLLDLRAYPVCAPTLRRGPLRRATSQALAEAPLLGIRQAPRLWLEWCAAAGVTAPVLPRQQLFDNAQVLYQAAAGGLGIALGVDLFTTPLLASGALVPAFADPPVTMRSSYYLVHRRAEGNWPPLSALRAQLLA